MKPNGLDPERFNISDEKAGTTVPIRELIDEALLDAHRQLAMQTQQALQQFNFALSQLEAATRFLAVLDYELERRRKSITIARSFSAIPPSPPKG